MEENTIVSETPKQSGLKLDFKRTLKVGFAFLGIMLFWEVYDYIMPLILSNYFGLNASQYGIIMGLDNLLAIFLLPLFGGLSDKAVNARGGRRTSFIFWGSIAAALSIVFLMLMEFKEYTLLIANMKDSIGVSVVDLQDLNPESDYNKIMSIVTVLSEHGYISADWIAKTSFTITDITTIQIETAKSVMMANPAVLVFFIVALLGVLVAMASYRSPAIALMPDVTPKPLRSQANALITLMGGVGGALSILVYMFFGAKKYESHIALWSITAGLLIVILVLYLVFVKEKKFVQLRIEEEKKYNVIDEEEEEEKRGQHKLSKSKMTSLILILATVFLWFMGYNCVRSHMSVYCTNFLQIKQSVVTIVNLANGIGGAVALLPCAFLSAKIGRKKTIFAGLILAAITYIPCFFMTAATPGVSILFPVCFILSGFGMVFVNVNTLPMVTELSKGSNVGKYTGFYYVASMTAQAITPFFAGLIMEIDGYNTYKYLFVYAISFVIISIVTTACIKHGDSKAGKMSAVDIINQAGDD
ncbi:MAG: MFS transporter [Clostridia bacterium]|nr:MFS transporter [Clostridia bacterium]